VGYHFGKALQSARKVPVGLIQTAWGGTRAEAWTSKEFLEKTPEIAYCLPEFEKQLQSYPKRKEEYPQRLKQYEEALAKSKEAKTKAPARPPAPQDPDKQPNSPCRLYNAMIAPLVPFAIKGAIWYQGESNAGKAYEYRTLFPTMIQSWRAAWGYDFPFLCVQLAPFRKISDQPQESDWAELREAQFLTSRKLAHAGQVVITDTTNAEKDQTDIHPKNKAPVGERLALAARQKVYGENIVGSGPIYESVKFSGDKAVISFTSIGSGLLARGEKLVGFTIAGADKKFVNADAVVHGDTVVVSSPEVRQPVAVRFGWADYPVVNLFNKEGLPATPFRTDEWPGKTVPKVK
jgi:sialate O-acetylesterase